MERRRLDQYTVHECDYCDTESCWNDLLDRGAGTKIGIFTDGRNPDYPLDTDVGADAVALYGLEEGIRRILNADELPLPSKYGRVLSLYPGWHGLAVLLAGLRVIYGARDFERLETEGLYDHLQRSALRIVFENNEVICERYSSLLDYDMDAPEHMRYAVVHCPSSDRPIPRRAVFDALRGHGWGPVMRDIPDFRKTLSWAASFGMDFFDLIPELYEWQTIEVVSESPDPHMQNHILLRRKNSSLAHHRRKFPMRGYLGAYGYCLQEGDFWCDSDDPYRIIVRRDDEEHPDECDRQLAMIALMAHSVRLNIANSDKVIELEFNELTYHACLVLENDDHHIYVNCDLDTEHQIDTTWSNNEELVLDSHFHRGGNFFVEKHSC